MSRYLYRVELVLRVAIEADDDEAAQIVLDNSTDADLLGMAVAIDSDVEAIGVDEVAP